MEIIINITTRLVLFVLFVLIAAPIASADGVSVTRDRVSAEAVIGEMNSARQNPSRYAGYLEELRTHYNGRVLVLPGHTKIFTKEGLGAVDEAIRFLRAAQPQQPLKLSAGMSRAAADHCAEQASGGVGHGEKDLSDPASRMNRYGTWGASFGENIAYGKTSARDIVIALIIDDGLPARTHRTNIFNRSFKYAGAGYGPHARFGSVCSIAFAGSYTERGKPAGRASDSPAIAPWHSKRAFGKPAERYSWKTNIVTTVFWIGEAPSRHNPVPNRASSWDKNWRRNYGGFDDPKPSHRSNYIPIKFTPRQNPFYCALPYNDKTRNGHRPEAPRVVPWFKEAYRGRGASTCKGRWIGIRKGDRVVYAQWEDSGPFRTDHWQYVFGNERPKPNLNQGAGLDVSPAVRDYLNLRDTDVTDWKFVEFTEVPHGPWSQLGDNNTFVINQRQGTKTVAKGAIKGWRPNRKIVAKASDP
jgi:uncharacterized protein YkwD